MANNHNILVTHEIPDRGVNLLKERGYDVKVVNTSDRQQLLVALGQDRYDGVLSDLSDKIDAEAMDAAGKQCKIFANYAVGFDNFDLAAAAERGVILTNTPGVLTDTVAEHAFSLILAVAHRIAESDRFTRAGKYHGWKPMLLLGTDVSKKKLGIVGLGRIGSRVAHIATRGFDMSVVYYDVKRNEEFERTYAAVYREQVDDVFRTADIISIHVPLLPSTHHLVNAERLALMKPGSILVNTSRGPILDEAALVAALQKGAIRGAGLDVYEHEPALAPGLAALENVVLTPHTASATEETRAAMSELAAQNIIAVLEGRPALNPVSRAK